MIVKMNKVYIVARSQQRSDLLQKLYDMGIVHLWPVAPEKAVPDEQTLTHIEHLQLALQRLSSISPAGRPPAISPVQAADEILQIQRHAAELTSRLELLHRQIEQLSIWGELQLDQLRQLEQLGIKINFVSIPADQINQVQAECVQVLTALPGKRVLLALVERTGAPTLPEKAQLLTLPQRDRPSIRAEAAQIEQTLKQNQHRLQELAHLKTPMQQELTNLQKESQFTRALRGAVSEKNLFALQGWAPAEKNHNLTRLLAEAGIDAAVQTMPASPNENPPTLIRYPNWVKPIKGLFDILGTLPGYKELDLSPFFMVALPLFAAMLIGDAGYGLVFMLPTIFLHRKITAKLGRAKTNLLITIGAFTFAWGVLCGNYFGVNPLTIAKAGGFTNIVAGEQVADVPAMRAATSPWATIGQAMIALAPLWDADPHHVQELLIKISLLFGCIHLTLAHLRQAVAFWPDLRALAQLGWCLFFWSMLGIIWLLFFGSKGPMPVPVGLIYMAGCIAFALIVLFTAPHNNPVKRIGLGFARSVLPILSSFSDTVSYIRLMAVGLASSYIALAFNSIAASVAQTAGWVAATPILLLGHGLNIGLCLIAIFAHGVRLNMLEFSSNAGVQWVGYAYKPFSMKQIKET